MPLPRRCKKCRCYVAPQLKRCPRCGKLAPSLIVMKPTKEERAEAREKRDAKVPTIQAKNIHWVPSRFALNMHRAMVDELKRRLDKADSARSRNAIRSEMRATKAQLARADVPSDKKAWTTMLFHAKQSSITIFISPKQHRYVLAGRDDPADLLIETRKKHRASIPYLRLRRFKKSPYARMLKKERQEEAVHRKRKKAKKEHRAHKRHSKTQS